MSGQIVPAKLSERGRNGRAKSKARKVRQHPPGLDLQQPSDWRTAAMDSLTWAPGGCNLVAEAAYNKEPRQLQAAVSAALSTAVIARDAPGHGDRAPTWPAGRCHHAPPSIPSRLAQRPRSGLALTVAGLHTLSGIPGQPAGGCPAASGVQLTGGATLACTASSQPEAGERAQGRGLARPRAPWTGSSNTRLFSTGVETRASWHGGEVGHA